VNPGELVLAAADGDREAWNGLVDQFTGLIWAVARGHRLSDADAGDVVQTTWLRLVEHLDRLQEPERVGAWLATTARRECLKVLSRGSRMRPTEHEFLDVEPVEFDADARLFVKERDAALWLAFQRLSDACQELLRILMSDPPPAYEDVAAALGRPIGSIGPTRGRCLERLRREAQKVGITSGHGEY
jgi:RNA polymerase sigma factor (sigma-70 family)